MQRNGGASGPHVFIHQKARLIPFDCLCPFVFFPSLFHDHLLTLYITDIPLLICIVRAVFKPSHAFFDRGLQLPSTLAISRRRNQQVVWILEVVFS